MRLNFQLSNVYGSVYKGGNVVFSNDGLSVYSPIGNRVTCFDLAGSKAFTFPFENFAPTRRIAISPSGNMLLSCDKEGSCIAINVVRKTIIAKHHFKEKVDDICFSPDGESILVTHGRYIQCWKTPSMLREFIPFVLLRTYTGHFEKVIFVSFHSSSKYFASCSEDLTVRIHHEDKETQVLAAHKATPIGAFWTKQDQLYTVSRDGAVFCWENTELGVMVVKQKFYLKIAQVTCAAFNKETGLLVVGFNNGTFGLWEMPLFSHVHTLSLGQNIISTVALNSTGEWIALGSAELGQLVVWEYKSESYILKQQGHTFNLNAVAYSPQGLIASGGDDSKIKLWNDSGIAFVTFDQHEGPIQGLQFAKNGKVLFSSSLDGTVRAFDLMRYRNFKTYTTPKPTQFQALAVDSTAEIVAAGTLDTFEIYVWSVQTGKLCDVIAGHTGPVSGLHFAGSVLVSCSWDKTCRVWKIFDKVLGNTVFDHHNEALTLAVRPDDQEVAVSCIDGTITFWDLRESEQKSQIEARRDIVVGRKSTDLVTADQGAQKYFTTLHYTADGIYLLAAGVSNFVCLYHVESGTLHKRFQLSQNKYLDGIRTFLNSKRMTEAGSLDALEDNLTDEDEELRHKALPGTTKGDLAKRTVRPEMKASCLRFDPTGRNFAVACTEGIVIFSTDEYLLFDPFDLGVDVTPQNVHESIKNEEFQTALMMALRLNEENLILRAFEAVPLTQLDLVCRLPRNFLEPALSFLSKHIQVTRHLEFFIRVCRSMLFCHAEHLQSSGSCAPHLRILGKYLNQWHQDFSKLCDQNIWMLDYILSSKQEEDFY